ncbi:hypothetical protein AGROH133_14781 (plasmid) [Agrobacterium tumefaciens]|nr:hypothetical protein AGROH133_14781 [Agrobacterium tumefaciens]
MLPNFARLSLTKTTPRLLAYVLFQEMAGLI